MSTKKPKKSKSGSSRSRKGKPPVPPADDPLRRQQDPGAGDAADAKRAGQRMKALEALAKMPKG